MLDLSPSSQSLFSPQGPFSLAPWPSWDWGCNHHSWVKCPRDGVNKAFRYTQQWNAKYYRLSFETLETSQSTSIHRCFPNNSYKPDHTLPRYWHESDPVASLKELLLEWGTERWHHSSREKPSPGNDWRWWGWLKLLQIIVKTRNHLLTHNEKCDFQHDQQPWTGWSMFGGGSRRKAFRPELWPS